jgi:hypothetical protein
MAFKVSAIFKGLFVQILLTTYKHSLDAEEKEADMTSIGALSWGSLSKSKIKAQKAKQDKSSEW